MLGATKDRPACELDPGEPMHAAHVRTPPEVMSVLVFSLHCHSCQLWPLDMRWLRMSGHACPVCALRTQTGSA